MLLEYMYVLLCLKLSGHILLKAMWLTPKYVSESTTYNTPQKWRSRSMKP